MLCWLRVALGASGLFSAVQRDPRRSSAQPPCTATDEDSATAAALELIMTSLNEIKLRLGSVETQLTKQQQQQLVVNEM